MRLDRLDLTRYGRFTDARIDFPTPVPGAPDLHVIFGPNEAGKSTLFSAWLDLLYGIPLRTRYDFLHQGPLMQIGAALTTASGPLDVVRVKRNSGSLQDPQGNPLPEAVMQAALAGLGRDGYAAMFSLDDDTLEQGGESILASRGDLGEMLFSASAGLAGLGPQLDSIRKELDGFHKVRAHRTTLKAAKDKLQDLDRQRRDLDVTASAAQKMQRDATAANKAWRAARQAETETEAALRQAQSALSIQPQQARLARLLAELQPCATLPDATEADDRALKQIDQDLRALAGQMTTRGEANAELTRRTAALRRDPAILPLADRIAEAGGLHPLHLAALADLPRRRDALAVIEASLARDAQTLGLTTPTTESIITPAALARLRALVARRDIATLALKSAKDEAIKAKARLTALQDTHAEAQPLQDLQSLSHLVAIQRRADPLAAQSRAEQDLAACDSALSNALLHLSPWRGSAEDLAGLAVPTQWQLAAWQAADQTTREELADATRDLARAQDDLATAQPAPTAGSSTKIADATDARSRREAAWAVHLSTMTKQTAATFEVALRHDDRIATALAENLAAAKLAAADQSAHERRAEQAATTKTVFHAKKVARQAYDDAIAACATSLGIANAALPDLQRWLDLRAKALTQMQERDQARSALTRAQSAKAIASAALAAAMALPETMGHDRLMAEALARLDTADRQQELAKRLTELQNDLAQRNADQRDAAKALADWQDDWRSATKATPLVARPHDDPDLATHLDTLDQLSRRDSERAELADRIAKMEANSTAFRRATEAIYTSLTLPPETPWTGIPDRLITAHQAERDHTQLQDDLAKGEAAQAADQSKVDALLLQRTALGTRLDWPNSGELADHLAKCQRARQLRHDIAEIEADLAHHPAPEGDVETLQNNVDVLQDALNLERTETEIRFAALTEARRDLAVIGGDDAVAQIAAERANLLNDLREQARAHLSQRFALTAFERGLRRYRDSHRSAMLARASDAFCQLSRNAYIGLAAQPEGSTEVLIAIPAQGGAKLATDLSKGTRFQLYLALRMAGYHELAKSRPLVPFIADDIMETFDDARAAQAFALLGDMSRSGQVIYLTHHEHLCDIAQTACPGAKLTDLRAI
jgi:uncharacterized protein YhaN